MPAPKRRDRTCCCRSRWAPSGCASAATTRHGEIARRVGRRLGIAADPALLLRIKETPHQTGLPLHERAANIQGAFATDPLRFEAVRGSAIALVDDVMTTGATAHEAALALKQAGASTVRLWVIARTPAPGG